MINFGNIITAIGSEVPKFRVRINACEHNIDTIVQDITFALGDVLATGNMCIAYDHTSIGFEYAEGTEPETTYSGILDTGTNDLFITKDHHDVMSIEGPWLKSVDGGEISITMRRNPYPTDTDNSPFVIELGIYCPCGFSDLPFGQGATAMCRFMAAGFTDIYVLDSKEPGDSN